jgi:hypothetical protein
MKLAQRDNAVPSSAHWNPTNPLRSKHQKLADVKAVNPAVKYWPFGRDRVKHVEFGKAVQSKTYRVDARRRRNNARHQQKLEHNQSHVHVKENDNLFPTCENPALLGENFGSQVLRKNPPTAVYFDLM